MQERERERERERDKSKEKDESKSYVSMCALFKDVAKYTFVYSPPKMRKAP